MKIHLHAKFALSIIHAIKCSGNINPLSAYLLIVVKT